MGAYPEWNSCSREDKRNTETLPQPMSQKNVKYLSDAFLGPLLQGDGVIGVRCRFDGEVTCNCTDK